MFLRALAAIAVLLLVSCGSGRLSTPLVSPYRMEIQQGNFITQEMVSQLKLGMSKDQVRFVVGTPLIKDSFHADRWDYVFRRQRARSNELEQHKLSVFFSDDKLVRIDSDMTPASRPEPAEVRVPAAEARPIAAPATMPEAQLQPAPVAVPESKPAATDKSAVDKPPQEKKGWWERLKDTVK
jgi:outer membrane protein assembly factor BamE